MCVLQMTAKMIIRDYITNKIHRDRYIYIYI